MDIDEIEFMNRITSTVNNHVLSLSDVCLLVESLAPYCDDRTVDGFLQWVHRMWNKETYEDMLREVMDTRKIEALLAKKYGYKNLPRDLSDKYRAFFRKNIPEFLTKYGSRALYTKRGSLLCSGYGRIVVGDYGAFVEFSPDQAQEQSFIVMPGKEYRINDPKYSKHVKYEWLTIGDESNIKIYKQKRTVSYADYKAGMYYVSVHEVQDER